MNYFLLILSCIPLFLSASTETVHDDILSLHLSNYSHVLIGEGHTTPRNIDELNTLIDTIKHEKILTLDETVILWVQQTKELIHHLNASELEEVFFPHNWQEKIHNTLLERNQTAMESSHIIKYCGEICTILEESKTSPTTIDHSKISPTFFDHHACKNSSPSLVSPIPLDTSIPVGFIHQDQNLFGMLQWIVHLAHGHLIQVLPKDFSNSSDYEAHDLFHGLWGCVVSHDRLHNRQNLEVNKLLKKDLSCARTKEPLQKLAIIALEFIKDQMKVSHHNFIWSVLVVFDLLHEHTALLKYQISKHTWSFESRWKTDILVSKFSLGMQEFFDEINIDGAALFDNVGKNTYDKLFDAFDKVSSQPISPKG